MTSLNEASFLSHHSGSVLPCLNERSSLGRLPSGNCMGHEISVGALGADFRSGGTENNTYGTHLTQVTVVP